MRTNLKRKTSALLIAAMLAGQCQPTMAVMAAPTAAANPIASSADKIVLSNGTEAAPIIIDQSSTEYDGISLNAKAFAGDIKALTKVEPTIHEVTASGAAVTAAVDAAEGTKQNFALASAGATVTDTGIHEDGIKKLSEVNNGEIAYKDGYWRGLNNGTASLTINLKKKVNVSEIDVVGRTEDGTAATEPKADIAPQTSGWANRKFTVSYKKADGQFETVETVDKTDLTVWDKITLDTPVETDAIRIEFQEDCAQKPSDFQTGDAAKGMQASVYVTEVQVWGTESGSVSGGGTVEDLPTANTVIIAGTVNDGLIQSVSGLDQSKFADFKAGDERYNIQVVQNPFDGINWGVVVTGSDKRGTIYGLYHISQDLGGLSPWYWWADVPVQEIVTMQFAKSELETTSKKPSVDYRGIFLNDESPSLTGWTKNKFGSDDPGKKYDGVNQDFYDHVFELILRLKGNYLWPAMWNNNFSKDGTEIVNGVKDTLANAKHADAWGVVMGTSHHEPMMRAGAEWGQEWGKYGGTNAWDFNSNSAAISKFWYDGAERNKDFENVITIGMRGENDSALKHPDGTPFTKEEQINVLKDAIKDQKNSLEKLGLQNSPQMICVYKEVEDAWYGDPATNTTGLNEWDVIKDDIVMFCEDNNGNLRTLPTEEERSFHKGGFGMYYHFDYVGGPRTYKWINTMPLAKTWANMTMAWEYDVRKMWIVNVGDLKPMELPISYFLDMAYDFDTWGTNNPNSTETYIEQWVEQQFPTLDDTKQSEIVQLLQDYPQMSSIRRPEAILRDTFSAVNYNDLQQRLADAIDMENRAEALWTELKDNKDYADAFYQLVYYPAVGTANVNQMQLFAGLNDLYYARGSVAANSYAALISECIERDKSMMEYYNKTMSDGKWDGMMGEKVHVGYIHWNEEDADYPAGKTVSPLEGAVMLVDVDGTEKCAKEGELTLPEFTSTGMECYALTISNGGNARIDYEINKDAEWINVQIGKGSVHTAKTLPVTIDWTKVTDPSATGKITITSGSKTVTANVKATKIDATGLDAKTALPADGVTVVNAADHVGNSAAGGAEWIRIEKLGKTGTTMRMSPTTTSFEAAGAGPKLTYKVYVPEAGEYNVTVFVGPSNHVYKTSRVKYGISVNGGAAEAVDTIGEHYVGGDGNDWSNSVLMAGRTAKTKHTFNKGENTIEISGMDAGLLLEKLAVSKEDLKKSHMGPKATLLAGATPEQKKLVHYQLEESMVLPGTIQAAEATVESGTVEKDGTALKAEKDKIYTYPVTVGEDGAYQFNITGKATAGASVNATLKCGEVTIGTVTLTGTAATVEMQDYVTLQNGMVDLTLTVDGEALIETIYAETLNLEPGLPVTVIASSNTDIADQAYDGRKSTSWTPENGDGEKYVGLDFDETVYTDWFRLYGSFDNVTGYEVQMSNDGSTWDTIYESSDAPEPGKKIYVQGTKACRGSQWRVKFTGSNIQVAEMEVNTFVNWAIEDTGTKVEVSKGAGLDQEKYKEDALINGDRIGSSAAGIWRWQQVKNEDVDGYVATLTFSKKHTISGVNLLGLQDAIFNNSGEGEHQWSWTGDPGEIPDDILTAPKNMHDMRKYVVSYLDENGTWIEAGTIDISADENKKVLTTYLFDEPVTAKGVRVEVENWYFVQMTEIEPIETRRYTLDGVREGYQNWALAANGGTVEASASQNDAKNLNDGIRICGNGNENRWRTDAYPASIEIQLSETINVSQVNLIGQQKDNAPVEPTEKLTNTFTYTPLKIQYKQNGEWVDGASIESNTLVLNRWEPEESIMTDAIRIYAEQSVGDGWLRLCEIEVFGIPAEEEEDESLVNWALKSNGGSATATVSGEGSLDDIINGEVACNDGRWRFGSGSSGADVIITLADKKEVSRIDLITQQKDDAKVGGTYPQPKLDSTTNLGIKQAKIYYKTASGSDWELLTELDGKGEQVWNRFKVDPPVVTDQIKFEFPQGSGTAGDYVRIVEAQVWGKDPAETTGDYTLTVESGKILSVADQKIDAATAKANEGDQIEVEADTPPEGKKFDRWNVKTAPAGFSLASASNATQKFAMPKGDVELVAEFADAELASGSDASYASDPENWAYVAKAQLEALLADPELITEEDQKIIDAGGRVDLLVTMRRKDLSGNNGEAKEILTAYEEEELHEIPFLIINQLEKTVKEKGSAAEKQLIATASNAVQMEFTLPEEWQSTDEELYNDYLIVSYTKDENGSYVVEPATFEWKTEGKRIALEASVNGSYALLVPLTYTVTFKNYDDTVLKTVKVKAGQKAEAPEVPEREGWIFDGWSQDFSKVTKNMTVKAKFTQITSERALIRKLEKILEKIEEIADDDELNFDDKADKTKEQLRLVGAMDFSNYVDNEEVMDLLGMIDAAAEDPLGITPPYVEVDSDEIGDYAEARGLLSALEGGEGYLKIRTTSVPGKRPSYARKIENAFALDVRMYSAKHKVVNMKGMVEIAFNLPDTLDVSDEEKIVVIRYTDSGSGKIYNGWRLESGRGRAAGGSMVIVTDKNASFTIANLTETGDDDPYYSNSSGGSGGGGGGGGGSTGVVGNKVLGSTVGVWKSNEKGWWYEYANGTYPVATWMSIRVGLVDIWYYFDELGYMKTGWFIDKDGNTYYLEEKKDSTEGQMATGWKLISGKWYYFNALPEGKLGTLYRNCATPDGNVVDQDGVWYGKQ